MTDIYRHRGLKRLLSPTPCCVKPSSNLLIDRSDVRGVDNTSIEIVRENALSKSLSKMDIGLLSL